MFILRRRKMQGKLEHESMKDGGQHVLMIDAQKVPAPAGGA